MKQKTFSLQSRLNSFGFAFKGIFKFFQQEYNAWIHLVATIAVFIAAVYYHVTNSELIALIIVSGFVWVAEIFNTVVEKIMDFISPGYHESVKCIKDLAAGGVMLSALTAVATGIIVFIPKIL